MNLKPVGYTPTPVSFIVAYYHSPVPVPRVPGIAPRYQCPRIVTIRVLFGLKYIIGVIIHCTGKDTQREMVMAEKYCNWCPQQSDDVQFQEK